MKTIDRLNICGVIPVVVIEDAKDAVDTAKALLAGGINVMEITFRTAAAREAIAAVAAECPDMTVGAGTVLNLEQCETAVEAGARFIVSPGFDRATVDYCTANDIAVVPGCVTPTEIMQAIAAGINVVKFFPAEAYGGLKGMKALQSAFRGIKFIPTGGVNADNLAEYMAAPFVHAVGGSWLCSGSDIAAHNFEKITGLCKAAVRTALGFEVAHIGINTDSPEQSLEVSEKFNEAFGFNVRSGVSSNFASEAIEVMRSNYLGRNGHIAVRTNSIPRAAEVLKKAGFEADMSTAKFKGDRMTAVYLKDEFGGFAVHLLQK